MKCVSQKWEAIKIHNSKIYKSNIVRTNNYIQIVDSVYYPISKQIRFTYKDGKFSRKYFEHQLVRIKIEENLNIT